MSWQGKRQHFIGITITTTHKVVYDHEIKYWFLNATSLSKQSVQTSVSQQENMEIYLAGFQGNM